jgi:ATP-binding cassette, subfamily C (CFTR/MRP), member 1
MPDLGLDSWLTAHVQASRKLHEKMAIAIFRSPMAFFDVTPAGRILNRFSSDMYRIDEVLARTFNMLFVNAARSCYTLIIISVGSPPFIALILPLALMYWYIQRYYLRTSRELKRLDSVSRSPIYAHFQETLGGVSTIRAYRQGQRFELENEWRVDANLKAYFPSVSANRWLAIRLEFIGAVVILAAAGLPIVAVATRQSISAGIVGLSMSYALQIVPSLNWIVRQTVEVETNIVSVERVLEYSRLPSEAPDIIPSNRPPVTWPKHGAISFNNFSTRYREGLDLVLKNINLDIKSHEKIGVVGRTGAGKSSLTLSLFRIIEPATGSINVDSLNSSTIGLLDLRRRLAIIPQDAALFEGSIRDNLDPGGVRSDDELWSVLAHARLKDHVLSMDGGLEAKINEGGECNSFFPRLSRAFPRLCHPMSSCVPVFLTCPSSYGHLQRLGCRIVSIHICPGPKEKCLAWKCGRFPGARPWVLMSIRFDSLPHLHRRCPVDHRP